MFYSIPNDNHAIGAFLYILLLNEGSPQTKQQAGAELGQAK